MSRDEIRYGLEQFSKALARLGEAVDQSRDELDRDGVIQRFEFTFERCWKVLKLYLTYQGKPCGTPREALKEAFRQGLFTEERDFLSMLEDRNLSSPTYDARTALQIFENIKRYLPSLQRLEATLQDRVEGWSKEPEK